MLDHQNSSISSIRTGSYNLERKRIDYQNQETEHDRRHRTVCRQAHKQETSQQTLKTTHYQATQTIGAQFLFVVMSKNSGKVKIIHGLLRSNAKLIHHINNHILPKSLNSTPHSLAPTFNLKPKTRKCLLKIKRKWQSQSATCQYLLG